MTGRRSPRLIALPLAVWERDGLSAALAKAGLPTDDLRAPGLLFWRFENEDVPVGFGGLEVHGDQALLRSVITLPPLRKRGFGRAMVAALETEARIRGCRAVWLLATTAADFFAKLDYARCDHAEVPQVVLATRQFATADAASYTAMVKRLD